MAIKYDGGILLGADGRSASVSIYLWSLIVQFDMTWIALNQIIAIFTSWFWCSFFVQAMIVGNRVSDKLEPIQHRIYCQRSGTSSHTQTIAQYVRHYIDIQA